jgi:hypothetical protein
MVIVCRVTWSHEPSDVYWRVHRFIMEYVRYDNSRGELVWCACPRFSCLWGCAVPQLDYLVD